MYEIIVPLIADEAGNKKQFSYKGKRINDIRNYYRSNINQKSVQFALNTHF